MMKLKSEQKKNKSKESYMSKMKGEIDNQESQNKINLDCKQYQKNS